MTYEQSYSRSLPVNCFYSDVSELVSKSFLREIADFWAAEPNHASCNLCGIFCSDRFVIQNFKE
jgi:hypothetical protein